MGKNYTSAAGMRYRASVPVPPAAGPGFPWTWAYAGC